MAHLKLPPFQLHEPTIKWLLSSPWMPVLCKNDGQMWPCPHERRRMTDEEGVRWVDESKVEQPA